MKVVLIDTGMATIGENPYNACKSQRRRYALDEKAVAGHHGIDGV